MNKGKALKFAIALACAAGAAMTPVFARDGSVTSNGVEGNNTNVKAEWQASRTEAIETSGSAISETDIAKLASTQPGYNARSVSGTVTDDEIKSWAAATGVTYTEKEKVETVWNTTVSDITKSGSVATAITISVTPALYVGNQEVNGNIGEKFKDVEVTVILPVGDLFGSATAVTWQHYNDSGVVDANGSGTISGGYLTFVTYAGFSSYTISASAPAPTAETKSESTAAPSTNKVQTCQDAGFPAGYYWDESKKACVVDASSVSTTASNGARLVPNTGDR